MAASGDGLTGRCSAAVGVPTSSGDPGWSEHRQALQLINVAFGAVNIAFGGAQPDESGTPTNRGERQNEFIHLRKAQFMSIGRLHDSLLILVGVLMVCTRTDADDWPQWRGINRDATINDAGLMESLPAGELPRLWSVPVGPGYSGPTVSEGRVYVMDRQGDEGNVEERILCFDAANGETIWERGDPVEYSIGYQAAGPRASVTVDLDDAFAVGGMGMFYCLDAATGDIKWKRDLNEDYEARMPIWGITASPLVYKDLVIQVAAGSEGACLVAMNRKNGEEVWTAIDERAGYSAPIIVTQGSQDVVVCWTGESITGLDPRSGDVFWSVEMLPRNMPIGVPTPVVQGDKLFVSSFYDGSMLIQLDQSQPVARKLWHRVGRDEKNTDALHCMISNPIIKGNSIYGFDSYGEGRCLDLATGDRIWEDLNAVPKARWATVHTIRNGDDEIMLNDQGVLMFATLTRNGLQVHSRAKLLDPTKKQLSRRNGVVWSHPAIADGVIYARNDKELVAASLRK